MLSVSFSLVVSSICFAGMAALSLAMDRHYEQVSCRFCVPRWHRIALRVLGVLLLFLSLWVCMAGAGVSVGAVTWTGWLTASALAVALCLTYAPRMVPVAAPLVALGGLVGLALFVSRGVQHG